MVVRNMGKTLIFLCALLACVWAENKTAQENPSEQSESEDSSLLDHMIDLIHLKPLPIFGENPKDVTESPEKTEVQLLDTLFHKTFFSDGQSPSGLESLFSKLRGSQEAPWWKGSNVCIEREEVDELENSNSTKEETPSFFTSTSVSMQTCFQTSTKYECTRTTKSEDTHKTLTIRYQCCHGFKLKDGKACEKFETEPLMATIKKLNGAKFLAVAKNFEKMLENENLTVFLPSDEALVEFSEKMLESNQVELFIDPQRRRRRQVHGLSGPELVQAHVTEGFKEICAEDTLTSLYQNSTLRLVNVYSAKEDPNVFVNCAKITSSNNYATNGIVHTIDKVMMPATHTLMEIVKHRTDFSMLRSLLENSGIADSLDSDSVWTLFAPTNEAFEKFHKKYPKIAEKLFNGDPCAINILRHHILPNVFCSSFIALGATSVRNSVDEYLKISAIDDESQNLSTFQVENSNVTDMDIIAKNGVVHIVNEIILPDAVLPISTLLLKNNFTLFHALIEKAGLIEHFDNLSNVSFLIPTDKAIKNYLQYRNWEFDLDKFLSNGEIKDENSLEDLKNFLYHHVMVGNEEMKFENDKLKETLTDIYPLRMNHYLRMYVMMGMSYALSIRDMYHDPITADCARVMRTQIQQCNSRIYVIDKPLILHNQTIWERMKNIPQLSILYNLLVGSEIQEILDNTDHITFTAPVNEVFEKMPTEDVEILKTNKKLLNVLMKVHITKGVTCCAGLQNSPRLFLKSVKALNGQSLALRKNKIGSAPITSCDHVADNGVLHFTNKLMIPTRTENNFDINLFGLSDI